VQCETNGFAFGARGGILNTSMPAAASTASKAGRELGIAVADQEAESPGVVVEIHQQVPGGLGNPGTGGVGGDPGQVHPPVVKFDDEEHVQSGESDRLDGEEVTCEGAGGLGAQKRRPTWSAVARCRPETVTVQNRADRGRRDPHAELAALANNAQITPARVLPARRTTKLMTSGSSARRRRPLVGRSIADGSALGASEAGSTV